VRRGLAGAVAILLANPLAGAGQTSPRIDSAGTLPGQVQEMTGTPERQPPSSGSGVGDLFWRSVLGVAGGAGGLLLGGLAGAALPEGECGDDPGLCEVFTGAIVGGLAGTVLMAAAPTMGSSCHFKGRAALALIGGGIGFGLGLLSADASTEDGALAIAVTLVFGSAAGATACRR
jgi:hypothetical protein